MAPSTEAESSKDVHLCVLVHGLWGNPTHLNHLATSLRQEHPEETLEILLAKRNTGNSTYDGIELGGERVTHEIEDEIAEIEKSGRTVTKLSMVGYSLGGLVARYAIGLLFARKLFDKIQPVNFTTFASPHLGVRTPLVGWHNDLWNRFGGRTLSVSGQQLFLIDTFRDTGRPLLAVLADPDSIFMRGLSAFKHRSLYANIINDRAVPFYTAYICAINPFTDLSTININYVEGYEDVILDSKKLAVRKDQQLTLYQSLTYNASDFVSKVPLYLFIALVGIPIGSTVYLVNSGIQSFRSAQRIKLHESGQAGIGIAPYRLPVLLENAKRGAERALRRVNSHEPEEYLEEGEKPPTTHEHTIGNGNTKANGNTTSDPPSEPTTTNTTPTSSRTSLDSVDETFSSSSTIPSKPAAATTDKGASAADSSDFPTLALTDDQFGMIESLDKLGFEKYAVHIHKAPHSHAAIIVRTQRQAFGEGKVVSRHWLERFEI